MEQADRTLSKNAEWGIRKADAGVKGPQGETYYLSDTRQSVWLPGSWKLEVGYTDDNIPYIFNKDTKSSSFCVDIFKKYLEKGSRPSSSSMPLPSQPPGKGQELVPASGRAKAIGTSPGVLPLPGMKPGGGLAPTWTLFCPKHCCCFYCLPSVV